MKAKVDLQIGGMTCQGCVRSIETKLSAEEGVSYAHVNLGQGKATVEFDDKATNAAKLLAAVEQIGFQVRQA